MQKENDRPKVSKRNFQRLNQEIETFDVALTKSMLLDPTPDHVTDILSEVLTRISPLP